MAEILKIKQDIIDSCLEDNTGIAILTSSATNGISTNVLRFCFKSDIIEFLELDIPKENIFELLIHEQTIVDSTVRKAISIVYL